MFCLQIAALLQRILDTPPKENTQDETEEKREEIT
jgi:hypothetical protein